jgi:hypothetical protein
MAESEADPQPENEAIPNGSSIRIFYGKILNARQLQNYNPKMTAEICQMFYKSFWKIG